MKVSLNSIKQYIGLELPPIEELVERINQQLGGVEAVTDLSAKYKGIVIAKVVKCEPHPDSDHLHVCDIDIGDYPLPPTVERLPSNLIQVVCGAPNVHADMFVAWLPPGATVPASFDKDPLVLDVRKIRGVESNGMLASSAELAIGDNHDGILEISLADLPSTKSQAPNLKQDPNSNDQKDLRPGMDFASVFGLDDVVIDIENKMFTHRPDLFGQLGVAREIAGIQQQPFVSPEWYLHPVIPTVVEESSPNAAEDSSASPLGSGSAQNDKQLELTVSNDAGDKVPRFMAVAIKDIEVKPSPLWLQCALVAMGGKPINNIVDVTNYVMLLTAQPTHAYDYDKLRGHKIGARMAKQGEQLPLLNGKIYTLEADDIVIVDGEGPVGLGGIMGGGNSEVSASTKNIVLEVANFDMYTVRKSSMRHGLFTDAVTRFNKGQSPLQNDRIIALLMQSVFDVAGGSQASNVYDEWNQESRIKNQEVEVSSQFINDRLGLALDVQQIQKLLENVEFTCTIQDTLFKIQPPFWRTDVELPEDIVEEVGRLYGFDKLPRELPQRSMKPAPQNPTIEMKRKIGQILSGAGANEVKTYSFVHERVLKAASQDPSQAFRLSNALSPDLQYYRLSLTPSLLAHVHANIKAGHDEFALYEFGKAHRKGDLDDEGLPREYERLAFVYAAKKSPHAAYYTARRYVEALSDGLCYVPLTDFDAGEYPIFKQLAKPFDPKRSAVVMNGDQFVGVVGEYTAATRRVFKLPEGAAGFEIFQSFLRKLQPKTYVSLSRFPHVTQDISLKVPAATPFTAVLTAADQALAELRSEELSLELRPLDIYRAEGADTKTITLRLKATNYVRTLTDTEVSTYMKSISELSKSTCSAETV